MQDDTIEGGDDHDTLFGAAGDDTLLGENGIDSLSGGAGDDNLTGGIGADVLTGGDGDDTQSGDAGRDTLYGLAGDDMLLGGGENDTYHINSQSDVIVELSGGGGMDEVIATAISIDLNHYDNVENARLAGARVLNLTGSKDRNILTGNMAANRMAGLGGADTLVGAAGKDILTGGAGKDYLEGGIGADRFIFASAADIGNSATTRDFIADFASGEDKIQLTFMSSYVGDARFIAAGQVRYDQTTGLLYGNTDADLAAEWALTIGFRAPAAGDFVF